MKRLVDKDVIIKRITSIFDEGLSIEEAIEIIDSMPDIDAVEVVRCKDCIYNLQSIKRGNAVCDIFYGMTDQYGFCHYGEKRLK